MKRLARWRLLLGRRGTAGAIVLLVGLLGMVAVPVLDGWRAHYVHIRWRQGITAGQQRDLEWQHGLRRRSGEGRSYGYDIVNESWWNIRSLLDNPFVEDVEGLDRDRSAVAANAEPGRARNGWAWRWGLEGHLPAVTTWSFRVLLLGVLVIFCSRPLVPVYMRVVRAARMLARFLPDVRQRRGRRSVGITAAVAGGLLLWVVGPLLRGATSPTVVVLWHDAVSADARQEREARYSLREQFNQGRSYFSYDLIDDSGANVRAIAADRAIVSLEGVDRARGVVLPTAQPGRSRTGFAWRWRVEEHLPLLNPVAGLLLLVGLVLAAGSERIRRVGANIALVSGGVPGESRGAWAWTLRHANAIARARVVAATAVVFLSALLLRWAALGSMGGDDHWSLWTAATFLGGDRPFREFVDPGDPLYWAMSALAQALVGYRAIGEVGLGLLLIASAIAVSFRMSWRASGSLVIALGLAATTAILVAPTKLYSYPKIFLYPLGIWLAWRYIDRPGLVRACWLALGVAVAFGYRHDHGAYIAVGASAAVLAAHWKNGPRDVAVSLVRVGLATILILSPYFALIQANEGLIPYFQERVRFAAEIDAAGRRAVPFVIERTEPLFYSIPPQTPVYVGVRWAEGVTDGTRAELEKRLALEPVTTQKTGNGYRYLVTDYSETNLAALFAEKQVVTAEGIQGSFRQGYAVNEPSGTGESAGIVVTWVPSASAGQIVSAERAYRLTRRRIRPGDTPGPVEYDTRDPSVPNVTALKQDPLVGHIQGVHFVRVPVVMSLRDPVPIGPPAAVRWAESVTPAERETLEKQFKLLRGRRDTADPQKSFWFYELGDASDAVVNALATSPRVALTDQLDRGVAPGTFKAQAWTPPRGAPVSVVWSADVTDDERRVLEQKYHLESDHRLPDRMTPYRLLDASPKAIHALVSEPHAVGVTGVDDVGQVSADTWFTAMGRRFAVLRFLPLPRLFHKANAGVWMYYVSFLLPLLVFVVLLRDWWRGQADATMQGEAPKMFALATLMAVANFALLRKLGYFPDHFDAAGIMAAWLLGRAFRARWRRPSGMATRVLAILLVSVSAVAASTHVNLPGFADTYGFDQPFATYLDRSVAKFRGFALSPPIDHYAPKGSVGDKAIVRYLYECTRPADRILVSSDAYTVPYYTQRRVVGHVFWANGFMANPEFERRMIELMERDPVPFVFGVGGEHALDNLNHYPLVRAYVAKRFTEHHAVLQDNLAGRVFWLLVDSRRTPTSRYEGLGLPCFR